MSASDDHSSTDGSSHSLCVWTVQEDKDAQDEASAAHAVKLGGASHPSTEVRGSNGVEMRKRETRRAQAAPVTPTTPACTNLVAWVWAVLEGGLSLSFLRVECVRTEVQTAPETWEVERSVKLKEGTTVITHLYTGRERTERAERTERTERQSRDTGTSRLPGYQTSKQSVRSSQQQSPAGHKSRLK